MATINYPCNLPAPLVSKFSDSEELAWQRNDVQSGAPRYTLIAENQPTVFSVSFSYSALEMQVFDAWYRTSIMKGVIPFNIYLISSGCRRLHECYFNSKIGRSQNGKRWNVSCSILAIEKQYNDDCDSQALIALFELGDGSEHEKLLSGIDDLANNTIPTYMGNIDYLYG